jgi:hypothetical protein
LGSLEASCEIEGTAKDCLTPVRRLEAPLWRHRREQKEKDKRLSRESMRLQEFPGTSDPAFASGIAKNLMYHRNPPNNDNERLTNIYRVKSRRRRAKCGLIPSF